MVRLLKTVETMAVRDSLYILGFLA